MNSHDDPKMNANDNSKPNPEQTAGAPETESHEGITAFGEAPDVRATGGTADTSADQAVDADLARLEAEKADLTERLVRLAADMDNLRKRSERDVSDARRYAVQRFAGDMLQVRDNLQRALEAVPEEAGSEGALGALVEGVEMTAREMDRQLEKHGVTRVGTPGERFDPNRHQAMFEVEDASVPAGTIVQVVQDGYMIGDRVLRAALVGVAKGGPRQAPAESAAAEQDGADREASDRERP